jgi:hypothetical protein
MNPGAGELEHAAELYKGFHWGRPARRRRRVAVSPRPRTLVELGRLEAITYSTKKGKTRAHWEHAFGEEGGKRPRLAMDARNRRLHVVGGDYTVEDRGIVN